jgi:di/tricarboxylate transporter
VLAVIAYAGVQAAMNRRKHDDAADTETDATGGTAASRATAGPTSGGVATAVLTETATETATPTKVEVTPMRALTLIGLVALLVLTTVLGIDVGVASLVIALALIIVKPSVQKPAVETMPWSAILLVTGIVTYVGVLEAMGALADLQNGIEGLGNSSVAALVTSYVVGIVSAFASTTGTLGVISPIVVPIAGDPMLTAIGVVTAVSISSSVVDTSPMSTSGALLMASAQPKDERLFFRALLLWAIGMIAIVPVGVWFLFVYLGIG